MVAEVNVIGESIFNFFGKKKYLLVYENGAIGVVSRRHFSGDNRIYSLDIYWSGGREFSHSSETAISLGSNLHERIKKLEDEGAFK